MAKTSNYNLELGQWLHGLYEDYGVDRQDLETKWQENEDAFDGISEGTWKAEEGEDWRSNTFIMLTKIKVITAFCMVLDICLENDQLPFNLDFSPWDNVNLEGMDPAQREYLEDSIGDMNGLIKQQVIDCKGDQELIKNIMAAAKLGETYWRSFVHDITRKGFQSQNTSPTGGMQQYSGMQKYQQWEYFEKIIRSPGFRYVSTWDMFRDLESDDLQLGQGYFERSNVSAYDLRRLIGKGSDSGWIDDSIMSAIEKYGEGVSQQTKKNEEKPGLRRLNNRYNNMERLDWFGRVPRETLERFEKDSLNTEVQEEPEKENDFNNSKLGDEIEAHIVLIKDTPIRLVRIPEMTRPHGRVVWELNLDKDHGIGVADNAKSIQLPMNGAWRSFEDNKKLSANVLLGIQESKIENWSGEFKPGEPVTVSPEAKSVAEAMHQIVIQDVGESLLSLIATLERYGDEHTMLPKILQGAVLEKQKPDTLGELNILQSNSGRYIGSVFKNFDNQMFEPITWNFYEYNMRDPDLEKGKGNYIAKPMGYEFFKDKVVRITKLMQAIQVTMNNPNIAPEIRFKDLYRDLFEYLGLNPDTKFKTPEEKQEDMQAMEAARKAKLDEEGLRMLAEYKAKGEVEIAKIREKAEAEIKVLKEKYQLEFENDAVKRKLGVAK